MNDIINIRQRRYNWLRRSRLQLKLGKLIKNNYFLLKDLISIDRCIKKDSFYYFILKNKNSIRTFINIGTQFKKRCFISGSARGVR